jgi:NTE family protein
MSSGFFGFFAHAGFLQGLAEAGLEPDAYAGTSSGALVAALAAAGMAPAEMLERFTALRKADFWDPPRGGRLVRSLLNGFQGRSGWLAGAGFLRVVTQTLPVERFEDCPRPCLVVALDAERGRRAVFTSGPLAPAVVASGSVPVLFSALAWRGGLMVDGGLVDKAPLLAVRRHLDARSLLVHFLPSASLARPAARTLARRLAPLRLQARAVDAAREQAYLDQAAWLAEEGVPLWEVAGGAYPRVGPGRLERGPAAFDAARAATRAAWRDAGP